MPTYDKRCECGHEYTTICRIANMDEPTKCPECGSMFSERFLGGCPSMGDPQRLGVRRPDDGFKDVLRKIDSRTPGSVLKDNCRYI